MRVFKVLAVHIWTKFWEQLRVVLPISVYLLLVQGALFRQFPHAFGTLFGGLLAVVTGLAFFMEGLKFGLMPLGKVLGTLLPRKTPLWLTLLLSFWLGVGVTFAEPALGALQYAGQLVDVRRSPILFFVLNVWTWPLVGCVAAGVGLSALVGTIRFLRGWSLKRVVLPSVLVTLGLTLWAHNVADASEVVGMAWDCGAVTTGCVTVPLVLSLGVGITTEHNRMKREAARDAALLLGSGSVTDDMPARSNKLDGFGIVTLASLYPVCMVLLLALVAAHTHSPSEIIDKYGALDLSGSDACSASTIEADAALRNETLPWTERTPGTEFLASLRALVPLVVFLFATIRLGMRERIPCVDVTLDGGRHGTLTRRNVPAMVGVLLCFCGLFSFNVGLKYGLTKLGEESGCLIPAIFTHIDSVSFSPLIGSALGGGDGESNATSNATSAAAAPNAAGAGAIAVVEIVAWLLGIGATLAEPALRVLGRTTEELTDGSFRRSLVVYSVAGGVAFGVSLGVLKLMLLPPTAPGAHEIESFENSILVPMLGVGYGIALLLTLFSSEEFVCVAWDAAGVTTGAISVPLILSVGLGVGGSLRVADGFGLLAMASVGPIISVLLTGVIVNMCRRTEAPRAHVYDNGVGGGGGLIRRLGRSIGVRQRPLFGEAELLGGRSHAESQSGLELAEALMPGDALMPPAEAFPHERRDCDLRSRSSNSSSDNDYGDQDDDEGSYSPRQRRPLLQLSELPA